MSETSGRDGAGPGGTIECRLEAAADAAGATVDAAVAGAVISNAGIAVLISKAAVATGLLSKPGAIAIAFKVSFASTSIGLLYRFDEVVGVVPVVPLVRV